MIEGWIFRSNLWPVLSEAGRLITYDVDSDDRLAFEYGLQGTDSHTDNWFGYEFVSATEQKVRIWISEEVGTDVFLMRFSAEPDVEQMLLYLVELAQIYILKSRENNGRG